MRLARSFSRLGTETAFETLARARALEASGRRVVHLEIGEPDFDTPAHVREAAKAALDAGQTHYGPSAGLPEARAAVAEHLTRTRGARVAPEEVIITPGGKPVIFFSMLALLDPGDEAIYPDPGFPIYESMIRYCGAEPVPVPVREENGWELDPKDLERRLTPRTRLVVLNSPGNPTGGAFSTEALERIARALQDKAPEAIVLSDEIYSRIVYEGRHHSILALPGMKERTILLDGFSKTWAMTGWRVGYAAAPKPLVDAMAKLAANDHSCVPAFCQLAAAAALTGPQDAPERMVSEFRRRRDALVAGLNALPGVTCRLPRAAFYAFPNIRALGLSSTALAERLLAEAGVACLAGTAFGAGGEGYLRFSYANSLENIEEALASLRRALPALAARA